MGGIGRRTRWPRPGVEGRPVVDEPRQHGVGVAKVGARLPQPRGAAGILGHLLPAAFTRRVCLSPPSCLGPAIEVDVDLNMTGISSFRFAAGSGPLGRLRAERSAVVTALRTLPARQREALVLRYYGDLSQAQIASTMGISRGAVKSHAARGMSSLRAVLEREA